MPRDFILSARFLQRLLREAGLGPCFRDCRICSLGLSLCRARRTARVDGRQNRHDNTGGGQQVRDIEGDCLGQVHEV